MSSISQIERWSSQTRMLAMQHLGFHHQPSVFAFGGFGVQQFQDKLRAPARRRPRPNPGAVGLDDLIDNRQAQAGPAFKLRLKRFEDLVGNLGRNTRSGIGDAYAPVVARALYGDSDLSLLVHG